MYVIFPAEEVVDLSLGIVTNPRPVRCHHQPPVPRDPPIREIIETTPEKPKARAKETKKKKKKLMKKGTMAAGGGEATLRDLTHPSVNEALKAHNSVTFKLVKTVSDFTQQLSQVYEQHAEELQLLVSNFRKRNAELRKERPACPSSLFHTWETLLQEVEVDSQAHQDIACILGRQVARPLLERSFHRKIQSRKVFAYRDSYEAILAKAEEKLAKTRQEYKASYAAYSSNPSAAGYAAYLDCHNAYVQQLHATNAMIDTYAHNTLPALLQELEEVYSDLCSTLSESVLQGAEIISTRAVEQGRRYDGLSAQCRAVLGPSDLAHFARSLNAPPAPSMAHKFAPPLPPPPQDALDGPQGPDTPVPEVGLNPPPSLKNELVVDRLASVNIRGRLETLKKEQLDLEGQIKQLKDALDTLLRLQQRSLESNLFNKANELQEDINMKRFDIRVAQIHLAAVKAQKELFATKSESTSDSGRERKMSSSSTGSMKNKWLKAFKSLKTTSGPNNGFSKDGDKKNGKDRDSGLLTPNLDAGTHLFQEYTYKKITPCDACSQILRGHTRQGLRCRICKTNVHADCQDKAARCQAKSRLLRRQKSTSEIETRLQEPPIEDESAAASTPEGAADGCRDAKPTPPRDAVDGRRPFQRNHQSAPHSPRRQKLNLRMKSLSLDSPESSDNVQRRHHGIHSSGNDPQSSHSSSSHLQSPSSPVHSHRLLSARNLRMSSVELPDDNEKALSSASTSPCPSPKSQKPHRLLPTNLYVVLYNFKSRHPDELDLKAGYKVTVTDTSDQDWWKGKCLGRMGYFPSKYVIKLQPGEKPLQVAHNLQLSDGDNSLVLLRDQIVIQVGEELDGMVMIRSGDNRQGVCPTKFLQEV